MTTTRQRSAVLGPAGIAVITLLTLLAVWTSAAGGRWAPTFTTGSSTASPEPAPLPTTTPPPPLPEDVGFDLRGVVLGTLAAILVVMLIVGLGVALRAIRTPWQLRDKDPADDDDGDGTLGVHGSDHVMPDVVELREGIAEAWARLTEDREPTDAIQAAWVAVEEAAERSGVPREASATPTEFTVAVLDRTAVDPTAIRTLLGLYHRARFSTHGATADDVALAGECLTRLDEGLAP